MKQNGNGGSGTLAGPVQALCLPEEPGRENDWNGGWKFCLGERQGPREWAFDDSGWQDVTLPHDFSICQPFTVSGEAESGFLPGGTGWYRKTVILPKSCRGKILTLQFGGVYASAWVYVNGRYAGENHYGYLTFALPVTDLLICDGQTENVVAVRALNPVPSSRWYSGSGIYRDVTLLVTDPVHVAYEGVRVTTPDIAAGRGTVRVETEAVNDSAAPVTLTLRNRVLNDRSRPASAPAETALTLGAGERRRVVQELSVPDPDLWSPETPVLYRVRTELRTENTEDVCDTVFGFRYFSFDSGYGFRLNGRNCKLNGVCLHADQGALGAAAHETAIRRQLRKMRDMGANVIRTSHNPPDRKLIGLCNRLGLLVVEDSFDCWNVARNGNVHDFSEYFLEEIGPDNPVLGGRPGMTWGEFAIRSLVRRDRNDPSVILWSLANEIQEGGFASPRFPEIAGRLIAWLREEDGTRPVTISDNTVGGDPVLARVVELLHTRGGIVGYNYATPEKLDRQHGIYGVLLSSETSSAVKSRGVYTTQESRADADGKYHLTSYDTSVVPWGVTAHESRFTTVTRDFVAGEFVWTGFDYTGEPTPWNGTGPGSVSGTGPVPNSSYFGLADTAGFPKDTYYFYRSQWNRRSTTVHLVTAWDRENLLERGGKTPVWLYTNAPRVELYRDGRKIGTAVRREEVTPAGYRYGTYWAASCAPELCTAETGTGAEGLYAVFWVAFRPGTLSARALDEAGREIPPEALEGRFSVTTPGPAARLRLTQSETRVDAGGKRLVYLEVEIQDARGNLKTTAGDLLSVRLTGPGEILGVDNGDPGTTQKYQQPSALPGPKEARIRAWAGKALVIFRATGAGPVAVAVRAPGLTGAAATVEAEAAPLPAQYRLVRDYTVRAGRQAAPDSAISLIQSDGGVLRGEIAWEPAAGYGPGDHRLLGRARLPGLPEFGVACRLHVVGPVVAVRNCAAATEPGVVPVLPAALPGLLADGTRSGEFPVTWEPVTEARFTAPGARISVRGRARVFAGQSLPVTASVRVCRSDGSGGWNVAGACRTVAGAPEELVEGGGVWTCRGTACVTLTWATAQLLRSVSLAHSEPLAGVQVESSLNGADFVPAPCTVAVRAGGAEYVLDRVINPVALRLTLTCPPGRTVDLTALEVRTFQADRTRRTSAALSALFAGGEALPDFDPARLEYRAHSLEIRAESAENAGITVLPPQNGLVRICTVSEDGSRERVYAVRLKKSFDAI